MNIQISNTDKVKLKLGIDPTLLKSIPIWTVENGQLTIIPNEDYLEAVISSDEVSQGTISISVNLESGTVSDIIEINAETTRPSELGVTVVGIKPK